MSLSSPRRQFELLKKLENKLESIKDDYDEKSDKLDDLQSRYGLLKEQYKKLEKENQLLKLEEKQVSRNPEPVDKQRSAANEKSLIKDLEYWKLHCKKLTERVDELESRGPASSMDMDHLKLVIGLTTLLDTDDPKALLPKLKSVMSGNNKLVQENESLAQQIKRQKEAHHQYRQLHEQLQSGFEVRLAMSKDALKDTYSLLQEKIERLKVVQKQFGDKDSELQQLKLEFNHFKQVHQKVIDEYNENRTYQSDEIRKLNIQQTSNQEYLTKQMQEKINILQKDLSNTKQKEYLHSREVAELKRLLTNDNQQWMNEIIKEVK